MSYTSVYTGTQIDLAVGYAVTLNANKLPAGTKAPFYQNTAPLTWTLDSTLDDKLLFVTKGSVAGGETGGAAHSTGTWTQPDHALTVAELAAHGHALWSQAYTTADGAAQGIGATSYGKSLAAMNYAGTGYYNVFGAAAVDPVQDTGSGTAHNHGSTWRPAGFNVIICAKD